MSTMSSRGDILTCCVRELPDRARTQLFAAFVCFFQMTSEFFFGARYAILSRTEVTIRISARCFIHVANYGKTWRKVKVFIDSSLAQLHHKPW